MVNHCLTAWPETTGTTSESDAHLRCDIPATGSQRSAWNPRCCLETPVTYRLSRDSESNMVNGMGIRKSAGKKRVGLFVLGLGLLLSGCMQQTMEPASEANLTPRD